MSLGTDERFMALDLHRSKRDDTESQQVADTQLPNTQQPEWHVGFADGEKAAPR